MDKKVIEQYLLQLGLEARRVNLQEMKNWAWQASILLATKQRQAIPGHLAKLVPQISAPEGLLETLKAALKADGWKVQERTLAQFSVGLTSTCYNRRTGVMTKRCITVVPYISEGQKVLTLLHEWTHGILHQNLENYANRRLDRMRGMWAEFEAEATAYVVGRALGVHSPANARYIAQRGGSTLQLLSPAMIESVHVAAEYILSRLPNCVTA
jgi:hypothetical protein